MHVLIVPSWYSNLRSPGAGSFFRDQAQALARAGHKVGILVPKMWGMRDYRSGPLPEMNRIRVEGEGGIRVYRLDRLHRLPRMPFRDARAVTAAARRLYQTYAAQEGVPDLIHAHCALYGGVVSARLAREADLPWVLTEHSTDFAQGRHRWWQKRLIAGALAGADARLAVSPQLRDILIGQYDGLARPIDVVPNILTPEFENNPPAEEAASGGPFVFLCVARISREKNQDGLVRAFARAFPGDALPDKDVELHFIGPGDGAPLEALARDLGVGGRVKVLGVQRPDRVRECMAAAGAVVLASDVETFGVVVIEAHSQGTPVIATISGGPEHLITPDNGILVPVRDGGALEAALSEMYARARHVDRARLRRDCLVRYGEKAVVAKLEDTYASVLSAGPAAAAGTGGGAKTVHA